MTFNAAAHFVDRNVEEGRGERIAIECGDLRVTYRQVRERVNRLGSALRHELGVRAGERVAMLLTDTPVFAYSFFGALKIGAVAVPVNTLWKAPDYSYVLNDTRARVLIASSSLLPQIEAIPKSELAFLQHVVLVGTGDVCGVEGLYTRNGVHGVHGVHGLHTRSFSALLDAGSPELEAGQTSRDDVALWLYSSGSTGLPKRCMHLHHHLTVCSDAFGQGVLGITAADRAFSVAKLFFAYGLGNALYMPFAVGATSILWPEAPTAPDVYAIVERYRPTLFFSVPTGYAMLLAHRREQGPDFDFSSVRAAVSAGEALPPALLERFNTRFGVEILDGIGSTETLHTFISSRPGDVRPGSCGRLVSGYEARVLDDDGRPVAAEEIGNLQVRGDSVCVPHDWAERAEPRAPTGGRSIMTGDKFHQDHDGFFWHAGQSDDMLKVGGQWVSPVEVERVLVQHEAVRECAVVGREDADRLIKPCAFVVARAGVAPDSGLARELQQFVRTRLADYKRPRWVEFVAALPKTATGKIQRYKLRARA